MTSALGSEGAGAPYRRDIDGLRAVAVLAVVAHHAWPGLLPGGFFGVDVFFVISGFLITGILMRERGRGPAGLLRFYARRVRRILPALTVMLTVTVAVGLVMLTPRDLDLLGQSTASVALLSSNRFFLSMTGYFSPEALHQPLLHTWSLSIEEQFYLLWPAATLAMFHPRAARWAPWIVAGLLVVSVAETVRLSAAGGLNDTFYHLRTRLWELLLGALLALSPSQRLPEVARSWIGAVGLVAIGLAVSAVGGSAPWPGVMALLPCVGAAMVLAGGEAGPAGRLLGSPFAVGVGLISYSLYLWHWPLLSLPQMALSRPLSSGEAALAASTALVLGYVSWRWVERPFRRPPGPADMGTVVAGFATLALLAGVGAALAKTQGLPGRAALGVLAAQAAAEPTPDPSCHVGAGAALPPARPCTTGEGSLVVVWGDSHAAHLMPAVRAAGVGMRVRQISKSSCPPVVLPGADAECGAFNDAVARTLASERPQTVILAARWTEYLRRDGESLSRFEDRVQSGLRALRRELGPEVRVVVWGPTPEFAFEPSMCWARAAQARLDTGRCERVAPRDRSLADGAERALLAAAESEGGQAILPYRAACPEDRCVTRDAAGRFLYRDDDHLTADGAGMLARLLVGRI